MSKSNGRSGKQRELWGIGTANVGADYSDEEVAFLKAVDRFKREHGVKELTCTDVLRIAHELGYRKVSA